MLGALQRVSIALYLLLGWSGLAALQPLVEVLSTPAFILLVTGGGLYTLGVAFFHWEHIPYQNAIWHGFVLIAAACHYGAILGGVVLGRPGA
jgi:hemolysin III